MSALPQVSAVPVRLETEIKERIAILAKSRKNSSHALMKEAIYEYVEKEEKKEKLKEEVFSTWREYQLTGLHMTEEEMDDWMIKLENGEEAELPACHV